MNRRRLLLRHEYNKYIHFEDKEVERICIEKWDKDGDGKLSKEEAAQVTNIDYIFLSSNVVDPSKDLEAFNIDKIWENSFGSCHKLRRIKYPTGIKHNIFAFRECSSLEEIDVNENCTDIIFATNALIGADKIKSIILRQKNAFEIPDLIFLFYRMDYPKNIKIYVRDELVDSFKSLHSGKVISNNFAPLSEHKGNY